MGVVRGSPFSSSVVEPATSALELPEILIDSLLRTANLVEANSLLLFPAPQDVLRTIRVAFEQTNRDIAARGPVAQLTLAEAGARFQSRAAAYSVLRRAAAVPGADAAPPPSKLGSPRASRALAALRRPALAT
jgi:hypothetical protein